MTIYDNMTNHFARLPSELRLQIFDQVFTGPTGVISLRPFSNRYTIFTQTGDYQRAITDLKILRTCWQFYRECRDLLWKLNYLNLGPTLGTMHYAYSILVTPAVFNNVRSIQWGITLTEQHWIQWDGSRLIDLFAHFENWNNLENLALVVCSDWKECERAFRNFAKTQSLPRLPDCPVQIDMLSRIVLIFQYARAWLTFFPRVKRELVFDFGEAMHPLEGMRSMRFEERNGWGPDRVFEELSGVLGGAVIINGVRYYSHGVLQKQVFVKDPLDLHSSTYYLAKDFEAFTLAIKRILRGKAFLGRSEQFTAWTGQVKFEEWLSEP